eukprot:CFRG7527T1
MDGLDEDGYDYQNTVFGSYRTAKKEDGTPKDVAVMYDVLFTGHEPKPLETSSGRQKYRAGHSGLRRRAGSKISVLSEDNSLRPDEDYLNTLQLETNQLSQQRSQQWNTSFKDELERARGDQDTVLRGSLLARRWSEQKKIIGFSQAELVEQTRANAKRKTLLHKTATAAGSLTLNQYSFLALLGVIGSLVALLQDIIIEELWNARTWLYELTPDLGLQFIIWSVWGLTFALIAAMFVEKMSPQARGSGIPEMKTIIAGADLVGYLSLRTLAAKMIGLVSVVSSGLSVGKEGPFVHICSIIANRLMTLPNFGDWSYRSAVREQMMSSGVAVGVSSTFGTPIGGVMFSIEVTSVYYLISTYGKCVVAAVAGSFIRHLIYPENALFLYFTDIPFGVLEYFAFATIGVLGGLLGVAFCMAIQGWIDALRYMTRKGFLLFVNPYAHVTLVSVLTSAAFFFQGDYARILAIPQVNQLLYEGDLCNPSPGADVADDWCASPGIYARLVFLLLTRFVFTVLAVSLPVPAGVLFPLFSMGAYLGRLSGEIVQKMFPNAAIQVSGYVLVGMAAVATGGTHTLSAAVIVFEISQNMTYLIPVLIATVISWMIATRVYRSVYTVILQAKRLPFLPALTFEAGRLAKDVMSDTMSVLPRKTTYYAIVAVLRDKEAQTKNIFPIVDTMANKLLVGTITRQSLEQMLTQHLNSRGYQPPSEHIATRSMISLVTQTLFAPAGVSYFLQNNVDKVKQSIHPSAFPVLLDDLNGFQKHAGTDVKPVSHLIDLLFAEPDKAETEKANYYAEGFYRFGRKRKENIQSAIGVNRTANATNSTNNENTGHLDVLSPTVGNGVVVPIEDTASVSINKSSGPSDEVAIDIEGINTHTLAHAEEDAVRSKDYNVPVVYQNGHELISTNSDTYNMNINTMYNPHIEMKLHSKLSESDNVPEMPNPPFANKGKRRKRASSTDSKCDRHDSARVGETTGAFSSIKRLLSSFNTDGNQKEELSNASKSPVSNGLTHAHANVGLNSSPTHDSLSEVRNSGSSPRSALASSESKQATAVPQGVVARRKNHIQARDSVNSIGRFSVVNVTGVSIAVTPAPMITNGSINEQDTHLSASSETFKEAAPVPHFILTSGNGNAKSTRPSTTHSGGLGTPITYEKGSLFEEPVSATENPSTGLVASGVEHSPLKETESPLRRLRARSVGRIGKVLDAWINPKAIDADDTNKGSSKNAVGRFSILKIDPTSDGTEVATPPITPVSSSLVMPREPSLPSRDVSDADDMINECTNDEKKNINGIRPGHKSSLVAKSPLSNQVSYDESMTEKSHSIKIDALTPTYTETAGVGEGKHVGECAGASGHEGESRETDPESATRNAVMDTCSSPTYNTKEVSDKPNSNHSTLRRQTSIGRFQVKKANSLSRTTSSVENEASTPLTMSTPSCTVGMGDSTDMGDHIKSVSLDNLYLSNPAKTGTESQNVPEESYGGLQVVAEEKVNDVVHPSVSTDTNNFEYSNESASSRSSITPTARKGRYDMASQVDSDVTHDPSGNSISRQRSLDNFETQSKKPSSDPPKFSNTLRRCNSIGRFEVSDSKTNNSDRNIAADAGRNEAGTKEPALLKRQDSIGRFDVKPALTSERPSVESSQSAKSADMKQSQSSTTSMLLTSSPQTTSPSNAQSSRHENVDLVHKGRDSPAGGPKMLQNLIENIKSHQSRPPTTGRRRRRSSAGASVGASVTEIVDTGASEVTNCIVDGENNENFEIIPLKGKQTTSYTTGPSEKTKLDSGNVLFRREHKRATSLDNKSNGNVASAIEGVSRSPKTAKNHTASMSELDLKPDIINENIPSGAKVNTASKKAISVPESLDMWDDTPQSLKMWKHRRASSNLANVGESSSMYLDTPNSKRAAKRRESQDELLLDSSRCLDQEVDFFDRASDYHFFVDFSPLQVVENTPLTEVHFLFSMLKSPFVFVTRKGVLAGIIMKKHLLEMKHTGYQGIK